MITKEQIYEKYPNLFARRLLPASESCMHWGIECRDGWLDLIDRLCDDVVKSFPDAQFEQVKQKCGRLRVYMAGGNRFYSPDIMDILATYSARSTLICERCGLPGEIRDTDWLEPMCDEHFAEYITNSR